ncbi:entericidin [Glycocaulis abyssi]|uniref:Entericidin n=1 Tax=Glycocaulis abyssi TaxID=1433403 RepID=A0ABV9NAU0_9PROT
MKRMLMAAALSMLTLGLSACNTIQGVGRDITRTGEVLEDVTS